MGKLKKLITHLEIRQKYSYIELIYLKNFWNFAIKHTCHIYNIILHTGNNNLIFDVVFYNEKVALKHLRTFKCICYWGEKIIINQKQNQIQEKVFILYLIKRDIHILL